MSKRWLMSSFGALLAGMAFSFPPELHVPAEAPVRRRRARKHKSTQWVHPWRSSARYPEHGEMVVRPSMSAAQRIAVEKRQRKCARRLALPPTALAPSSRPGILSEAA